MHINGVSQVVHWLRIQVQCRRLGFDTWVRKIPWRRKLQPIPLFLPGEFHCQRSLMGYHPWSHKESDITEHECSHIHVNVSMTEWSYYFESVFCGPTIFQYLSKFIKVQVHFSILPHLFRVVKSGSIFITIKCFESFLRVIKILRNYLVLTCKIEVLEENNIRSIKRIWHLSLTEKMRPGSNKIIV